MARILPKFFSNNFGRFLHYSKCEYSLSRKYSLRKYYISTIENRSPLLLKQYSPCINQLAVQFCTDKNKLSKDASQTSKPTLFQRFKSMYKDYWYVLIPVHVITSVGWLGGFYYMAISGVDIIGLLESMKVSEKIIDSMRGSQMGYFAITYACYKIATPARYTVTLGGTTISINYLKKWGYIKPVPSAEKLKQMYQEKKDNFDKTMREKREDLMARKDELIAKKEELKSKLDDRFEQGIHKIEEFKDKTSHMKKKAENMLKEKK